MQAPSKGRIAAGVITAVLLVGIVLGSWLIIRSASVGGKGADAEGPPHGPEPVIFAPSISYNQALRLITDMGLQPSLDCPPSAGHYTPGSTLQPQPVWQPVGQRETFSQNHQLLVSPTFSAPLDWRLRLVKIPGVQFGASQVIICPRVIYGTPLPGVSVTGQSCWPQNRPYDTNLALLVRM